MQYVKQEQAANVERSIIEARGEQQVAIFQTEGEKRVAKLRAEAQAHAPLIQVETEVKANKLLSESINENILRLRAIEVVLRISTSPNAKLILNLGGDSIWVLGQDLWPVND